MKGENLMNTRIIPLGGLGEVGKNMYVVACKDEIIIVLDKRFCKYPGGHGLKAAGI